MLLLLPPPVPAACPALLLLLLLSEEDAADNHSYDENDKGDYSKAQRYIIFYSFIGSIRHSTQVLPTV